MKIKRLLLCLLAPQLAGGLGSIFTAGNINSWYIYLKRPFFAPPNWLFGPVWLILYFLMGLAAYLVWQKGGRRATPVLQLFWWHLALNFLWTPVFFGLHNLGLAFLVIIALWLSIVILTLSFYKLHKTAAWLLLPYLLWVSFASILNFAFWRLN